MQNPTIVVGPGFSLFASILTAMDNNAALMITGTTKLVMASVNEIQAIKPQGTPLVVKLDIKKAHPGNIKSWGIHAKVSPPPIWPDREPPMQIQTAKQAPPPKSNYSRKQRKQTKIRRHGQKGSNQR